MKIGIQSSSYTGRYGFEKGIERLVSLGYETLDYQDFVNTETPLFAMNAEEFEKTLTVQRKIAEVMGVGISQTHGPWRWPPRDAAQEDRDERFEKMSKALLGTSILGCKYMVIHPIMPYGTDKDPEPERFRAMNYEFLSRLCEVGKSCKVTVCLENMPMPKLSLARPSEILGLVRIIGSEYMKVCLDTGHCVCCDNESPADAVRLLGKEYLKVLHVHDNNGWGDFHRMPYDGNINWADFTAALKEIDFGGSVSLETGIPSSVPEEIRRVFEKGLALIALKIAGRG